MIKRFALLLACAIAPSAPAFSQAAKIPLPPMNFPAIGAVHLGTGPYIFDTAEQHKLRVTVIARVQHPFSMVFLPNGDALVVERQAALHVIRNITAAHPQLDPNPVVGAPKGIHDIVLHPNFAANHLVYFSYEKPIPGVAPPPPLPGGLQPPPPTMGGIGRGKFDGKSLTDIKEIITDDNKSHDLVGFRRMMFGSDGMLYITTAASESLDAGDLGSVYGKVLRLRDDGSIPSDNPFVNKPGARPEVYAYGLRDQLGILYHAASGQILAVDNGPSGGDELNVIRAGRNYGWPKYSFGRRYDGPRISELPVVEGIEQPIVVWNPSVAPSGLEIYTGDKFPAWKGNVFVGSGQRGEINRTGGLVRVVLNDKLEELRQESLLTDLHLRVRFVKQGPDGLLYVLVEQGRGPADEDSAVLRLEPAPQ
jgi:glucose/arabinose dehydrogenase